MDDDRKQIDWLREAVWCIDQMVGKMPKGEQKLLAQQARGCLVAIARFWGFKL